MVSLVGYNLAAGAVSLTAELVAADGSRAEGGSLVLEERSAAESGLERLRASFVCPPNVAPGDYELVVALAGAGQTASIPLRVSG